MTAIRGVLAAIALFIVLSACTDYVLDASYATRAEAEADGAMRRGWIPVWIPPDATHLREVHNQDSNESALRFEIPKTLGWKPPAPCRKADRSEFAAPDFDRDWLPDMASGYVFYRCPTVRHPGSAPMVSAVAVHESGRHAVHWRTFAR